MIDVIILGASGYTGAELVRIILRHEEFKIIGLSADRKAGLPYDKVFPHLRHINLPLLQPIDQMDFKAADLIFSALPHSTSQDVLKDLPNHLRLIDLSADFRLRDPQEYLTWYGKHHAAPNLQQEAVYGLTEFYREEIKSARLVACTGCNAAAGMFPLIPLIKKSLVDIENIIISLVAGVSGAGRLPKEGILHSEVSEGASAYSVPKHRHMAEFDQEFKMVSGKDVRVRFVPHLIPQNRGILATVYVDGNANEIYKELKKVYENEPFIVLLPFGEIPSTHHVRGSNYCHLGVVSDRVEGKTILFSALDNLTKGSAGQAVQNANLMFGLSENMGLDMVPLFP